MKTLKIIALGASLILLVACSGSARKTAIDNGPSENNPANREALLWSRYTEGSIEEALASMRAFERDLLTQEPYVGAFGKRFPHVLMIAELRLFALNYYLGRTNAAEGHFVKYTNLLTNTSPSKEEVSRTEALCALELLERKLNIRWRRNTNNLVNLPPSVEEVESYRQRIEVSGKE
jgi:hypothetical protein